MQTGQVRVFGPRFIVKPTLLAEKQTGSPPGPRVSPPRGSTYIEFVVAMVLLGVALVGLLPIMLVQSRALESLELRYTTVGNQINLDAGRDWFAPVTRADLAQKTVIAGNDRWDYGNWYFIPAADQWARKLGAAAALSRNPPVQPPAPIHAIDDDTDEGNEDYVEESGSEWTTGETGYRDDARLHPPSNPPPAAAWNFRGLRPGRYNVWATWPEQVGQPDANNAQYKVYTVLEGVETQHGVETPVNQHSPPPSGVEQDGRLWMLLTPEPCNVRGEEMGIRVRLSALTAANYLVADAVRVEPVDNKISVLSIDRCMSSTGGTTAEVRVTEAE
jgi:type II secretory pathway pseudopilin PulG